jgi:hypothetical protein
MIEFNGKPPSYRWTSGLVALVAEPALQALA